MIKLKTILTEQVYEYSCAMLYFNFPEMELIHLGIDPNDLYHGDPLDNSRYGLEDEPHCTLLYGLHPEVTIKQVEQVTNQFDFPVCIAKNMSLFKNEMYDVLKYDIEGPNLHKVNTMLKQYPHTSSYPNYHPHMTVAYLNPGAGDKYVDQFKNSVIKLEPAFIVYSQPNGVKSQIQIKHDKSN